MDCRQAKILLGPHILVDLDNEPLRCKEMQAHLLCCPDCAEMYDGFKETIGFVLEHKAEFAQAFENARAREKTLGVQIPSPTSSPKIRKIFIKFFPNKVFRLSAKNFCACTVYDNKS